MFSRRIAEVLPGELRPYADPVPDERTPGRGRGRHPARPAGRDDRAGRRAALRRRARAAARRSSRPWPRRPGRSAPPAWEATNLLTISTALAGAARLREETRGSHWREDFPDARRRALVGPHRRPPVPDRAGSRAFHAAPRRRTGERRDRAHAVRRRCRPTWSPSSRLAGLDPRAVYDQVVGAVEEDLPGRRRATSPATRRSRPTRAVWPTSPPGSRESSPVSASPHWSSRTCSATTATVTDRRPDGTARRGGRRGDARFRPGPGTADRRAHRPELRLPPLRRRDCHLALGGRARGHQRARAGHPQDAAGLPGPPEVRRALRRRGQPPVLALGHGDGQGQPRGRGRRGGPGVRRGPGSPPRTSRWRSR